MELSDLVARIEQVCEWPPGTLSPSTVIEEIPGWSSLAFLGLIAMVDDAYSITLKPKQVLDSSTINDLFLVMRRSNESSK